MCVSCATIHIIVLFWELDTSHCCNNVLTYPIDVVRSSNLSGIWPHEAGHHNSLQYVLAMHINVITFYMYVHPIVYIYVLYRITGMY